MKKLMLIILLGIALSLAFADDDPPAVDIPNYYSPIGSVSQGEFVRYYTDSVHHAPAADSTKYLDYSIPTRGFDAGRICGRHIAVHLDVVSDIEYVLDRTAESIMYLDCIIEGSVDNKTFFTLYRKHITSKGYVAGAHRSVHFDLRDLYAPYIRVKWRHSNSLGTDDGYYIYGAIRTTIIAYGGKIND